MKQLRILLGTKWGNWLYKNTTQKCSPHLRLAGAKNGFRLIALPLSQTDSIIPHSSTFVQRCMRRASQWINCLQKAKSKKRKLIWNNADKSFGTMDTFFAN